MGKKRRVQLGEVKERRQPVSDYIITPQDMKEGLHRKKRKKKNQQTLSRRKAHNAESPLE